MNHITRVIEIAGLVPTAEAVGLSYQAVRKWETRGFLPRTEFTGETNYAEKLSALVDNEVTVEELLSMRPTAKAA